MASIHLGEEEIATVLETLAQSDEAMFVIDERQRIVFWNAGMQQHLGYTYDDLAGRSCCSILAGTDSFGNRYCSESCPIVGIAGRGEAVRPYRLHYRARSGAMMPLDVVIVRFTLRSSKRLLLAHIVRNAIEAPMPVQPASLAKESVRDIRARELTSRELEILGRLARCQSSSTIARELGISPLTTRNHIQHVFEKLEVHSRSEAVALAYRMNLV